jgi:septal ring-binding cell division protein DamX
MKDLLGGLLVLVLVFGGGYCTGKHYEQEAQQAEVDRLNTEARAKEAALEAAVTTTANALRVTNEKAKLATKQRDAAIDAGAYKLRLKASCPVQPTADPATPSGGGGGETSAELSPEAGKAIFAIAEEGDRAITKLNACIDLYNQALESQKGIK